MKRRKTIQNISICKICFIHIKKQQKCLPIYSKHYTFAISIEDRLRFFLLKIDNYKAVKYIRIRIK